MQCLVLSWASCQNCLLIVFLSWLSCHICPAILCSVWDVLSQLSCNIDPLRKVSECLIKIVHKYIKIYIYICTRTWSMYTQRSWYDSMLNGKRSWNNLYDSNLLNTNRSCKNLFRRAVSTNHCKKMKSLISCAANSKYNCRCSFNVKLISTDTTPVI
jgi:hypothetical protein